MSMTSMFDLTGRVVVVTGGNGGIGLGIASALAMHGCSVSIWGRNPEKNATAEAALQKFSSPVQTIECDVSSREQTEAATKEALRKFGRIDGCFANAGIGGGGRTPFTDITAEDWRKMFATNLDGTFYSLQPIVAHMVQRATAGDAFGRLVATSSMASLFGTARNEHYAASKAAVNLLMQSLAVEYARYGVTANAILPGWVDTEMIADLQETEKFMIAAKSRVPLRRFGWPSDFGAIAVYLMSQGSGYHTGDTIVIDGGYSIF